MKNYYRTEEQNTLTTILDRAPIARERIAEGVNLRDFLTEHPDHAELTTEQLERALYEYCDDIYWSIQMMLEDGDILYTEGFAFNTEDELEEWERAIDARFAPVAWFSVMVFGKLGTAPKTYTIGLSQEQLDFADKHDDGLRIACWKWLKAHHLIEDNAISIPKPCEAPATSLAEVA